MAMAHTALESTAKACSEPMAMAHMAHMEPMATAHTEPSVIPCVEQVAKAQPEPMAKECGVPMALAYGEHCTH